MAMRDAITAQTRRQVREWDWLTLGRAFLVGRYTPIDEHTPQVGNPPRRLLGSIVLPSSWRNIPGPSLRLVRQMPLQFDCSFGVFDSSFGVLRVSIVVLFALGFTFASSREYLCFSLFDRAGLDRFSVCIFRRFRGAWISGLIAFNHSIIVRISPLAISVLVCIFVV